MENPFDDILETVPEGFCQCGCGQPTGISERNRPKRNIRKGQVQRFLKGHKPRTFARERFWAHVDIGTETECWHWKGDKAPFGYGTFTFYVRPQELGKRRVRKRMSAHRAAYILTYGPVDSKLVICHHCDNPICCNPTHLFAGTRADNIHDMIRKNRQAKGDYRAFGEAHYKAKLTTKEVHLVRQLYSTGEWSYKKLAKRFDVTRQGIRLIVTNKNRVRG